MGFLRWPLLFCAVYSILWVRHQLLLPTSNSETKNLTQSTTTERKPLSLSQLQEENSSSPQTLSYAFQQIKAKKQPATTRRPSTYLGPLDIERVQRLSDKPFQLLEEVETQLSKLSIHELPERIILLREALLVQNIETQNEIDSLYAREREWLYSQADRSQDSDKLVGYVGELMRLSLMADTGQTPINQLFFDMGQFLEKHPKALKAVETSIQNYAQWEYQNWLEGLSHTARQSLHKEAQP
jgi:hypothetical protein